MFRADGFPIAAPLRAALLRATRCLALPAALLLVAGLAHAALTLDRNAPIQIEADSAVIDEPTGSAVYRGRVLLKQGQMKLQSTELTVFIKDGKAVKAIAAGKPVLLDQAPTATEEAIHAEARRITFLIEEDRMLLDDQASLQQGERLFQGAHIDYNVAQRRVNASGGGSSRVLLVLPPTPAQPAGENGGAAAPDDTGKKP
ncbi:MAG: lipopolysaccharide transport periplasmic protein LptA [Pseudomonadota bacterium]